MATPVVPSNTARVQLIDEFGVVYKATGGGSSVEIQVEGVDNASQTLVNFVSGTPANCTISNPSGGVVQFDITAAGTGDVVGPASATPSDIVVFNGGTGKLIADGGTTIAAINSSIAGKLSAVTADAPLSGSGTSGSHLVISQSGAATNGYLSSTDWNTFNNKQPAGSYLTSSTGVTSIAKNGSTALHGDVTLSEGANITLTQVGQDISIAATGGGGSGTVTNIATSNGITGGPITTTGTISGVDAAADGVTKGVAAFTASDFDAAAGVISIDYTNGQAADATQKGFLTSADWSTFNAKQPAGSYITASSSDILTNKTLDAEGTGNVITAPFKMWFPFAGANNTTPGTVWDLPASNAAVPTSVVGTNIVKGVLAFADGQSAQMTWLLPSDWTGAVDAKIVFTSPDTSGTVIFNIATAFSILDGSATDDPSFNTADAFNTITLSTPANAAWNATKTGITMTNGAAGKLMHIKISRATDTATSAVNAIALELTYRRAM